ncbi:MAG: trehalose-6-phosphate synthase [Campylobacter sp.]|nr:trehalose-6-phosphate synthase [Campylobacter sp.]
MYFIALCVHIFCAIAFVGYLFFDACIYPFAKKNIDEEILTNVKKAYTKGSAVVLAIAFLLLLISGIYLGSHYIGIEKGFFSLPFQALLSLKLLTILLLFVITFISIYAVKIKKKPDPFGKYSHIIGLVLCIIIVFLAKAMWYV